MCLSRRLTCAAAIAISCNFRSAVAEVQVAYFQGANRTAFDGFGLDSLDINKRWTVVPYEESDANLLSLPSHLRTELAEQAAPGDALSMHSALSDGLYPACGNFLSFGAGGDDADCSRARLHRCADCLSWQDGRAQRHDADSTGTALTLMKEHLEQQQWQGRIPKVACVTILSSASEVRQRLRFFISAFLAQTYEGPRELILVYRSGDAGIAQAVRPFIDGLFVKEAVVPRTPGTRFPSVAAYLAGARQAQDADVIARWDFSEWHHPDRLALQVRALALTMRSACLLPHEVEAEDEVEEEDADGEIVSLVDASSARADSLVGEAAWMREHWSSLLPGEPLAALPAPHHTVIVSMPELLVSRTAVFRAHQSTASHLRGSSNALAAGLA